MESSDQKLKFEEDSEQTRRKNFLTCDENLLSEMSELSGGSFYREENFHELKDALRPISSGRIIITEIILWQSFGWLVFVVSILGLEMFLEETRRHALITPGECKMNTELDPIITRKLNDFRTRQKKFDSVTRPLLWGSKLSRNFCTDRLDRLSYRGPNWHDLRSYFQS